MDVTEVIYELGTNMTNIAGTTTVLPDASSGPVWESEPLTEDLHIAGMPRVHVEVSTASLGGQPMHCWRIRQPKQLHPPGPCYHGLEVSCGRR